MFPTLMSKTFLILGLSLGLCYFGAYLVIEYFRRAFQQKKSYVTATRNEEGEYDLEVDQKHLMRLFWPALILNVIAYFCLLSVRETFPLNMVLMGVFTLTDGVTLGVVLISVDENLALRVSWLTALVTVGAGLVSWYSEIDFSVIAGLLFWALCGLLLFTIYSIFKKIGEFAHQVMAAVGIVIFTGYLLLDFGKLKQAQESADLNDWSPALNMSIHIYLDIINLFLQILKLMGHRH